MIEEGEIQINSCDLCSSQFKYKCPACEIKTCSLKCCKQHKSLYQCSGKRENNKLVKIDPLVVKRDYNYIDNLMKETEVIQKKLSGITALPDAMRYKLLKQQARKHGIDLLLAPKIMTKHRDNLSFYSVKDKIIYWCLEIKYYEYSLVTKPIPSNTTFKDALLQQELFKSEILDKYSINLQNLNEMFDQNEVQLQWNSYAVTEFQDQDEYKFKHQKKRFTQIEGRQKILIDIKYEQTIEEVLKGYTVFEFPTIFMIINKFKNE